MCIPCMATHLDTDKLVGFLLPLVQIPFRQFPCLREFGSRKVTMRLETQPVLLCIGPQVPRDELRTMDKSRTPDET